MDRTPQMDTENMDSARQSAPASAETGRRANYEGTPRWKRGLDVLVASACLGWAVPLGLMVAGWIRLTSPGPIFFRQQRIGLSGQVFWIWKFRTMHVEADSGLHRRYVKQLAQEAGELRKLDASYRLIPGGRLLRALALDELPQLGNVLVGEMSLVGPRPDVLEWDDYEPWQRERFAVLPGITGLWQVSGKNRTTFREMIELDLEYIRRRSLALDLWILVQTVPAVARQWLDDRTGCSVSRPAARRAEETADAEGMAT
ncbi:MAG: sugar transferase [Pirellulaceae bacterium]